MSKATDDIQSWDIDDLKPYEKNSKIHTDEQVQSIANSIREFGFDQPIVVDGAGEIIKGHGRWAAAKHLEMKKVPVIVRTDLTANQARASRLADNRVAVGDVDTNLLNSELLELVEADDINMMSMGFTDKELEFMTEDLAAMDEDGLVEDLEAALEGSASETEERVAALASKNVSVKNAFGFSTVIGEQAKKIARFMTRIEGETELEGADALCAHIDSLGDEE